ncbi:MAG: DinB family protein [Candidatus Rokuibacteriota bacterium]
MDTRLRRRGLVASATFRVVSASATPDPVALLADARRELARLPAALEAMLADLDDALWRARPAPKEWSPVEIVCHLRDEETEDFGMRVRAILDGVREYARIDPERWAVERRYHEADPHAALAALLERRAASLAFLRHVDPQRLTRAIEHPRVGPMSGLDFVAAWVAHDRLHLAQLAATLARTGADHWAPLRSEYAGPIPYPPPVSQPPQNA